MKRKEPLALAAKTVRGVEGGRLSYFHHDRVRGNRGRERMGRMERAVAPACVVGGRRKISPPARAERNSEMMGIVRGCVWRSQGMYNIVLYDLIWIREGGRSKRAYGEERQERYFA